jgi:putative spermidine/putrescine transport system substrate-binding protein/spermidine/putrescine transport system substrate-binding protein
MKGFQKGFVAIVVALLLGLLLVAGGCAKGAKAKNVLSIICFQGYAEQAWVKPFEEANKCTVKVTYAGTVDEMFTKVKAAPAEYTIVSIDSGRIKLYNDSDLIQPVDVAKLQNYNKIGEFFREHPYNDVLPGKKVHVPIVWGTQTMTLNTAKLPKDKLAKYLSPDKKTVSLDILTAPEFKGKSAFFDETTNVACISAIHVGVKDPFNFGPDDWDKVQNKLLLWKRNARTFTTGLDSEFSVLSSEDALMLLGGNDALLNIKLAEAGIQKNFTQYAMTQGTICWLDGWVITKPTKGRSYELALKYIDYMIGDKGQTELAQLVGFGIVNPAGASGFNEAVLNSCYWYGQDIGQFPAPLYIMVAEEDPGKRVEMWNKVKATP